MDVANGREAGDNEMGLLLLALVNIDHGILPWCDSRQVPSEGILDRLSLIPDPMDRHEAEQGMDLDALGVEYLHYRAARTPEALARALVEVRAAHGQGVELVNIFAGERLTT